jgi:hypothetical protein
MMNEIIYNDEVLFESEEHLPLKKGDKFYFSMRSFYPKQEKIYRDNNKNYPVKFIDQYLDHVNNECNKHHIHYFKVKKITFSVSKDYSKYLLDNSKGLNIIQSIVVVKVIRYEFWSTYKFKSFWKNLFKP